MWYCEEVFSRYVRMHSQDLRQAWSSGLQVVLLRCAAVIGDVQDF